MMLVCISWTPFRLRTLEDLEVPVTGWPRARKNVLAAPIGLRPLKDFDVPVPGSRCARVFVSGVALCPRPLVDREVSAFGRVSAVMSLEPPPHRSI